MRVAIQYVQASATLSLSCTVTQAMSKLLCVCKFNTRETKHKQANSQGKVRIIVHKFNYVVVCADKTCFMNIQFCMLISVWLELLMLAYHVAWINVHMITYRTLYVLCIYVDVG